jgi:hypothetical protein
VSGSGQFVVGNSESEAGIEAFLWSSQTGMVGLGHLPGETTDSRAWGVSNDGVVVGAANQGQSTELWDAFIWDEQHGMRNLQDVLIAEYGLGEALAGWTLNGVLDISNDGLTMGGGGTNPSGFLEAFVVKLDSELGISIGDATVIEGDTTLRVIDRFVADGSGGLTRTRLSTFGPDVSGDGADDLYAASADTGFHQAVC